MNLLAAHQPNYLPWIGYFWKMAQADVFVLADDVQFTKHGFTNRAAIRTGQGYQLLTVPVLTSGKGAQSIREVTIDSTKNWSRKHWVAIQNAYHDAPFFKSQSEFFRDIYQTTWTHLGELNIILITHLHAVFGFSCHLLKSSALETREEATARIVDLAQQTNSSVYISGPSGRRYLDEYQFQEADIELRYVEFKHPVYNQGRKPFVPNLSVLDLLFWVGPTAFSRSES